MIGLVLALSIALVPLAAEGQQTGKVWRVGFVNPSYGFTAPVLAFSSRLRDNGLVEGENVQVDRQLMGGREDQYSAVLADLERRVDVIVVTGPPGALAARRVDTKVPVIFAAVGKKGGLYVIRVRSKGEVKVPPHWHPTDEHITVLTGSFLIGRGDKYDASKLNEMKAGAHSVMPATTPHFGLHKGMWSRCTGKDPLPLPS